MDDTGRHSRDQREGLEPDPLGKDFQLYLDESWAAIEELKKKEIRTRKIRTLVATVLTLVILGVLTWLFITYVEFRDPVQAGGKGILAWLVVPGEDSGDFKFYPADSSPGEDGVKLGGELLPVLPLKPGDELQVEAGAQAILFLPEDDLRQEYEGPCNLTVTHDGPQITAGEGQLINSVAIADWLRGLKPADLAPPAEENADAARPVLRYPVGCSIYNGIFDLEWEYGGAAAEVTVGLRTRAGELLRETPVDAGTQKLGINLDSGKGYRWDVTAGDSVSAAGEFRVISDAEREWISVAARACGLDGEDIIAEAPAGSNVHRMSALYTVLVLNNLTREADAVLHRLKPIGGVE